MPVMFRRYNLIYAIAGGQKSSCKAVDRYLKKKKKIFCVTFTAFILFPAGKKACLPVEVELFANPR